MRLSIDHVSEYRFSEPQARLVQLLRLRPCDNAHQTVVAWRIDVDCDARLRKGVDGFGNETTMLYAEGPLDAVTIRVTGEILTSPSNGVLAGGEETLPPVFYLRSTPSTLAKGALADFADEVAGGEAPLLERLHALNSALHARFETRPGTLDEGCTAADAFEQKAATPRAFAKMFIAAARHLGVPARYVSGYRRGDGEQTCAPHAWAEAYVDGLGWVGFDAWAGLSPDDAHVRMAVALDGQGAAAISGSRLGAGEEELEVEVQVERLGAEA